MFDVVGFSDFGPSSSFVVLICSPLMTTDIEHIFVCLFVIYMSSLVNCILKYLVHLKNKVVL